MAVIVPTCPWNVWLVFSLSSHYTKTSLQHVSHFLGVFVLFVFLQLAPGTLESGRLDSADM